ncbi:MAG: acetylglutamate kinase [Robiginitomaculum sp.]|nr:MAG: acetylglutamate kinase [Robiginitomaculum sp.]
MFIQYLRKYLRSMTEQKSETSATRQLVRELLGAMTEGREVRAWLKQFGQLQPERFAIVKIGGGTLRDELDTICSALSFLQKLGLSPIVVHGGGPQIDTALADAGIKTPRLDGLRVTSEQAMPIISAALREVSLNFISALNAQGVQAQFCPADTVQAKLVNPQKYGRVGAPDSINYQAITRSIQQGNLPILTSIAIGPDGKQVNVNADALVRDLAIGLKPQKIIFLTPTGGILDENGQRISVVQLVSDYENLVTQDWLNGGMRLKLQQIQETLDELPLTASAAITSPDKLIKELFTHSGSGTLIRKGEAIHVIRDFDDLDRAAISELIETSFGRDLHSNFWKKTNFEFAVLSQSCRAVAMVSRLDETLYLDKFAVLEEARGEGLGAAVWTRLLQEAPCLFWRSRVGNPINPFYFQEADGNCKIGQWQVFWRGSIDWPNVHSHLKEIADLPDSFLKESQ